MPCGRGAWRCLQSAAAALRVFAAIAASVAGASALPAASWPHLAFCCASLLVFLVLFLLEFLPFLFLLARIACPAVAGISGPASAFPVFGAAGCSAVEDP